MLQEERKWGRVCSGISGIFPPANCYLWSFYASIFNHFFCYVKKHKEAFNAGGVHFTVACEQRRFDHKLEMLDFENTMWTSCHFSRVGILENCLTANPLNSRCTVVLLKTLIDSSTKALSRDVASYHEAYFHKGQIRQEIYSMTAALSLPKIRGLRYTERV